MVVISKAARTVSAVTIHVGVRAGSIYDSNALVLEPYASRVSSCTGKDDRPDCRSDDERGVSLPRANRHVLNAPHVPIGDVEASRSSGGDRDATGFDRSGRSKHARASVDAKSRTRQPRRHGYAGAIQMRIESASYGRPSKGSAERVKPDREEGLVVHDARFAPSRQRGDCRRCRAREVVAAAESVLGTG